MADTQHTRRQFLATGATVAGAAALTACSGGDDQPAQPPPPGGDLMALAEVPVGSATSVTVGENDVIVARPTETSAAAFSAVCTHQGCTVHPEGAELRCPCHGSVFDLSGQVRSGPADAPLAPIAVRVEGGRVVTA